MKIGFVVKFKNPPSRNTPGTGNLQIQGEPLTGIVVREEHSETTHLPHLWCEVMWADGEVGNCYKCDLETVITQ